MIPAAYIPNTVQAKALDEILEAVKTNLQAGSGGIVCLHGETLSGLTTVLHCLLQNRRFGLHSPWLLKMVPLTHLSGVRSAILHSMRLPDEKKFWSSEALIPRFFHDYLVCSRTRVVLVDDFHIVQKLSKPEQRFFQNVIKRLIQAPYSLTFVLAGNFATFLSGADGWSDFKLDPFYALAKFKSSRHVQVFACRYLEKLGLSREHQEKAMSISFDDARAILALTKGYVGEVVSFLSIMARESKSLDRHAFEHDIINRASSRYRVRNG
jgi:hypothetical protein